MVEQVFLQLLNMEVEVVAEQVEMVQMVILLQVDLVVQEHLIVLQVLQ
tara:strand:- start:204 stop:347 length:144 start_codon:yes stop_codon:yes gene_type:complete